MCTFNQRQTYGVPETDKQIRWVFELHHDKTNKVACAPSEDSAWASAQSDQSLRCPLEETLDPQLPTERTAKTLIRLGGCPG